MSVLGVIPARGGSKGVPRKNLASLAGKPLIAYTIETALQCDAIDRVVVSTEDDEISEVATQFGAEVIKRPAALAADTSRTEEALIHALETLEAAGDAFDIVLTLEPTSPFRSARLMTAALDVFGKTDADAVISVTPTKDIFGKIEGGQFQPLIPGQPRRRQEREPLYKESSTLYATRADVLKASGSVLGERLYTVVAEAEEALDINTPEDLELAEFLLARRSHV